MLNALGEPQSLLLLGGTSDIALATVERWLAERPLRVELAARPDVPGLLQGEAGVLGEPQLLGARPGLAPILGAVHGGAVDEAVRGRVDRAVARIRNGVEDLPALEQRAGDLPVAALVVRGENEQALPRADEEAGH